MVTRNAASYLMQLIDTLNYVYERSRSASEVQPLQPIQVKGENLIFQSIQAAYKSLQWLTKDHEKLDWIREGIRDWVAYLDRRYPDQPTSRQAQLLIPEDAANLAQATRQWINAIINYYRDESKTVYINEKNLTATFPNELMNQLDKPSQDDLHDGIRCILHLEPTPAAMILFRVAEKIVRTFYEKTAGNSATGMSWGQIVTTLQTAVPQKKEFLGYLDYLRTKRNEAEHPDKRFVQEEAERIALQIKGLLEETK